MALVYEEIGRACSSVRGFLAVHSGEMIGCYCLTEPNAGSDAASLETTATRDGDDWLLNDNRIWVTNGNIAHLAIVFATADPSARHRV